MNGNLHTRLKDTLINRAVETKHGMEELNRYPLDGSTEVFIYPYDIRAFNPITDACAFDGMTVFGLKVNTKHLKMEEKK